MSDPRTLPADDRLGAADPAAMVRAAAADPMIGRRIARAPCPGGTPFPCMTRGLGRGAKPKTTSIRSLS